MADIFTAIGTVLGSAFSASANAKKPLPGSNTPAGEIVNIFSQYTYAESEAMLRQSGYSDEQAKEISRLFGTRPSQSDSYAGYATAESGIAAYLQSLESNGPGAIASAKSINEFVDHYGKYILAGVLILVVVNVLTD